MHSLCFSARGSCTHYLSTPQRNAASDRPSKFVSAGITFVACISLHQLRFFDTMYSVRTRTDTHTACLTHQERERVLVYLRSTMLRCKKMAIENHGHGDTNTLPPALLVKPLLLLMAEADERKPAARCPVVCCTPPASVTQHTQQ